MNLLWSALLKRGGFRVLPQPLGQAAALMLLRDKQVEDMASISKCDEPGQGALVFGDDVSIPARLQVGTLSLGGYRRKRLARATSVRVICDLRLKTRDKTSDRASVMTRSRAEFHEANVESSYA